VVSVALAAMERCGKHISVAVNQYVTVEEAVFSEGAAPSLYNEDLMQLEEKSRVGTRSNTSTVTLRVVGGDGKGSLESETVKYGHESHGTRTRK
jgi:hypothetical protein